MTTLAEYIVRSGLRQSEMARALGLSRSYFSEIASGKKSPSLGVAARIETVTGGQVSASSLLHIEAGE